MDQDSTFGRYKLQRSLGVGGMGEVFLARASGPGGVERPVAIKVVRELHQQNDDVRRMFFEEAKVSFLLTHPNIVQTYEIGEVEGQCFLVLEYVDGVDLDGLTRHFRDHLSQPIPLAMALYIGSQIGRGLHAAHSMQDAEGRPLEIVHRDISPTNVLLSRDGLVKVADFGLAKSTLRGHETDAGVVKGKLAYMAPEQVAGARVDRRADIFALGVTLYELLAGRHPLELSPGEITYKRRLAPWAPSPLAALQPQLPAGLVELVDRCILAEPAGRFDSARQVSQGLDGCMRDLGLSVADYELAEAVAEARAGAGPARQHPFDRALGIELKRVGDVGGLSTFAASSPFPSEEADNEPPAVAVGDTLAPGTLPVAGELTSPALPQKPTAKLLLAGLLLAGLVGGLAYWMLLPGPGGAPVVVAEGGAVALADGAGGAAARAPRGADAASPRVASDALRRADAGAAGRATATLTVAPEPVGGRVWVGGRVRGTAPLSLGGLAPGPVEVKIVTRGRQTYRERVVLEPGATLSLRPRLAAHARPPRPPGFGTLSVNTDPWSFVYVDGKRVSSTPLRGHRLAAGRYRVRLVNPGRKLSTTRRVTIRPGRSTRLIIDLGAESKR